MIFLAELNQMEAWGTDISSTYLEVFTKEKLFVKAGPEFIDQEGHILLVEKALYGLLTSGVWWNERLADCLRQARESPACRWLTPRVDEVSSCMWTKGFPLLTISVGLLCVSQSSIGVHIGGRN